MSQQIINVGSAPNDGTGDPFRTGFQKTNANFTELYGDFAGLGTLSEQDADNVNITNGSIVVSNLTTGNATISGGSVTADLAGDGADITYPNGKVSQAEFEATGGIGGLLFANASHTFQVDTSAGISAWTLTLAGAITAEGGAISIGSATGSAAYIDSDGTAVFNAVTATSFTGDGSGITGVPISGVTGLASGVDAFLESPTSANLRSAMTSAGPSNVTGSGALVYASSPVLVTPTLGTPSSGTLTSCTGYTTANLSGTITNAQLAGSIAYSKLSLTGAILNADLAGSIAASKLVGSDIATVGTLTAGATGAGFTVALTTSTITGNLPDARNTVSNSTTTTLSAVTSLTAANSMTIGPASGASKTLTLQTTTSGGTATTAVTIANDQTATFASACYATAYFFDTGPTGMTKILGGAGSFFPGTATSDTILKLVSGKKFHVGDNGAVAAFFTANATTATIVGVLNAASGTATPANGSTSARLVLGTTAGFGIYYGSGAPTVSAAKGSWYMRSDGSGSNDRAYVNTDGSTTWTPMVTVG